jgi:fibronectin type 3 domain-containing protein
VAAPHQTSGLRRKPATRLLILLAISTITLAPTCGKRKPPQPPIERVPQRTELLSGAQRGNQVILSWPAPRRNAGDGSVQSIRRVDVYRVAEKSDAPLPMTEEEFQTRSTLIGSVPYEEIRKGTDNLTYTDTLELAEPSRLRYAVRYVNSAGQRASFSNFLMIEPAAKVAEPPVIIKTGKELAENALTIFWEPPKTNIDGSTPVNLLGYNIYRVVASQPEVGNTPINSAPVTGNEYQDRNFKFGEKYTYVVRAVSLGPGANPVESLNSNSVELTPVDSYPPSAPGKPSVGPQPGKLSIFWPLNPEPDIAGYILYKTTDPDLPKDRWTIVTPALLTKATYVDENVEPGKTYFYYVIAVDTSGNKSQPSEVESDKLP